MLRIIFSRLGRPHIGPASAFSFNTAAGTARGAITLEWPGTPARMSGWSPPRVTVPGKSLDAAMNQKGTLPTSAEYDDQHR
jgi:hypothetical protein